MPSPFPGMDPYLEGHLWTSIHAELATVIAHQLNPHLRPKYIALPERMYIPGSAEEIMISSASLIPDVGIRKTRVSGTGMAEMVTVAPSVKLRSRRPARVPHYRIEIRDANSRTLVTAIELLSPTNKGSGRKAYLRKRRLLLASPVHLLEVDLYHQGKRVPLLDSYPEGGYFVLLSRVGKRSWTDVWAVRLQDTLPTVAVPLRKGDDDVPLNLQQALTSVYDAGSFDLVVNYRVPPDVDLSDAEASWLAQHLRSAGFRK